MAAKLICTKWEHGELLPKLTPRNQSKPKFIYMGNVDSGAKVASLARVGSTLQCHSPTACSFYIQVIKNGTWDSDSEL